MRDREIRQPKPVIHSIRIEKEVFEQLGRKARANSVSFNHLINQVLKKYVEFDQFADRLGFVFFHKDLVSQALSTLDDEEAQTFGESVGGTFSKDVILTLGLPMNRESLLYFIEKFLGRYGNFFNCQRNYRDGRELYYLRHDLGLKWSIFLKGYTSAAFRGVLDKEPEVEVTNDGISFTA